MYIAIICTGFLAATVLNAVLQQAAFEMLIILNDSIELFEVATTKNSKKCRKINKRLCCASVSLGLFNGYLVKKYAREFVQWKIL